jgi:hypothetical protein
VLNWAEELKASERARAQEGTAVRSALYQ